MRRSTTRSRVRRKYTQFPKHPLGWELPEARAGDFMPAAEKATDRVVQMKLYRLPRLRHRAVAEVVGPSRTVRFKARATSSHGAWFPGRNWLRMRSLMEATAFFEGCAPL